MPYSGRLRESPLPHNPSLAPDAPDYSGSSGVDNVGTKNPITELMIR